jgi:hypothetical protein
MGRILLYGLLKAPQFSRSKQQGFIDATGLAIAHQDSGVGGGMGELTVHGDRAEPVIGLQPCRENGRLAKA